MIQFPSGLNKLGMQFSRKAMERNESSFEENRSGAG